jgi:amidophosphoribosyltransferase
MAHTEAWHGDRPKEECGLVGLWDPDGHGARKAFFSLFALQHRGQESAGMAVSDGGVIRLHKGMGLVGSVFDEHILEQLPGALAVGHTRYSTTGVNEIHNAQPIQCVTLAGDICVAHNGNLVNTLSLRAEMEAEGERFATTSDTEIIAKIVAQNIERGPEIAAQAVMDRVKGAYSVIVLTPKQLICFRDPFGIRPLSIGRLGAGWMAASESCAFEPIGGSPERELNPGECAIIEPGGMRIAQISREAQDRLCLFEMIYFARPDSVIRGRTVYGARYEMGRRLFAEEAPGLAADVVIPVPDSGIPAALGYSQASGIPFVEGMMKSRYIHRTFIQPDQTLRERGVRMKLSPLRENIIGRRLVVVDDSIVRATTTGQIIRLLRDAGAREVHVRITAPPIIKPCFYGVDMSTESELAAANMSIEEIRRHVGADSLRYLSIEGASEAVGRPMSAFCLACFNGDYPVAIPAGTGKLALEADHVGEIGAYARV